ncbi:DUF2509 family protein [Sodalis ligni]|uniref:DUF2509 family protein n=1 Tax=Sodalis ligni TaxID=2697027 RepID=UPI00193EDCA4|nr:DUF2509 family protein [Sodalis ligni]QWA12116.1 DUF2509 family protein [Sodalis ligni]
MMPVEEQGSGALAVLPILLIIGLTAMLGWQRFLDGAVPLIHDEQRYLTAFHRAESALSWAMTVPWRGEDGECRRPEGEAFRACLCAPRLTVGWVLHAQSGVLEDARGPGEINLYRRVALTRMKEDLGETGKERRSCMLTPLASGWLDYYPG